jgi:sec-independent protein translocase protein TatA
MLPCLAFFQNIGLPELVIILLIALLIFGHKLPAVARSLGSSVNEFKKGVKADEAEAAKQAEKDDKAATAGAPVSQLKCANCGALYIPAASGAPCPNCNTAPPKPPAAAEKN